MANYKITDIEGVGAEYAKKLKKAGVHTTTALLKAGATPKGRQELVSKTGIGNDSILKWVNMADLYRVKGVGSEYSELLEKAGVDTVKELKTRKPDNLTAKLAEVNSSGRPLVRQLPGLKRVTGWIENAKKLPPKVTY